MAECNHTIWRTIGIIIITMIFTVLLEVAIIFGYIWFKNPLGIKDLMIQNNTDKTQSNKTTDKHPMLNDAQEKLLSNVGIDPAKVPTKLTPELTTCLIQAVGEKRAAEIKAGAEPNIDDLLKAKKCINN